MFPFRDRDNKSFTRESADQIMDQLRQSLDEERKRFFDSNSKRRDTASTHSRGFPFDDDPFRRKSSRLKGDLHGYLAERYPDIADQLKDWTDDSRFDRHLDNHRPPSGRREEHQKPSGRPRGHQEPGAERRNDYFGQGPGTSRQDSLRNTVPNMQTQQDGLNDKQRNARSQSAPPEASVNCRPDKAEFPSAEKNGETNSQSNARNSQHQHEEPAKPQTHTSKTNERYIPIFVEGRGETIVNVPVQTDKAPQPPPPFARQSPPRAATPSNPPKEPADRAATPGGQDRSATPSEPAPEEERPQTPAQARPPSPMTLVANVQKDVLELKQTVDAFKGSKSSKEYIYLDEMLTRNLLKLDNIETGGKEELRAARKEVIKLIQECINVLESASEKGGAAQ